MYCPTCGAALEQGVCTACGFDLPARQAQEQAQKKEEEERARLQERGEREFKNRQRQRQRRSRLCFTLAAIMLGLGILFVLLGFDKKNNYKNNEDEYGKHGILNSYNAYVGGDAYNLIINGTYFTGYLVLGAACLVCATPLFCTGFVLRKHENEEEVACK